MSFLNAKKKQLGQSATIHDLLAYLQNNADFDISDNHVIFYGTGANFTNGHAGNTLFKAMIDSEIQGQSVRGEAERAFLAKVEETTFEYVYYDSKTGKYSFISDDEKRKWISKTFRGVWERKLKKERKSKKMNIK